MIVAAYQFPLAACRAADAIALIREQVARCETLGVEILCCPEGVLGGLADYSSDPAALAIDADGGELDELLAPLASDSVATIVGFTEAGQGSALYNSAAVFHGGAVVGVYRKLHPAINHSVYSAGNAMPVFTVGAFTFGIMICRDSAFPEPAATIASKGAAALFIPTNNGMPPSKGGPALVADARSSDVECALEHAISVVRADVVGRARGLVSHGSSGIVAPDGTVLASAQIDEAGLIVTEIETAPRRSRSVSHQTTRRK